MKVGNVNKYHVRTVFQTLRRLSEETDAYSSAEEGSKAASERSSRLDMACEPRTQFVTVREISRGFPNIAWNVAQALNTKKMSYLNDTKQRQRPASWIAGCAWPTIKGDGLITASKMSYVIDHRGEPPYNSLNQSVRMTSWMLKWGGSCMHPYPGSGSVVVYKRTI